MNLFQKFPCYCLFDNWERGRGGDTAVVIPISDHHNITRETPISTPRILDQPVLGGFISSITSSQNSVVEIVCFVSAQVRVVNATSVKLEGGFSGINGNWDWSVSSDGTEQRRLRTGWDVSVALDGCSSIGGGILAGVRWFSCVWVWGFRIDTIVADDVLESRIHQTSVASHVALRPRAVHQVLFRQANKFVACQEVSSFGRSSCGKRPARAALSLVFDWGHSLFGSPIKSKWDVGVAAVIRGGGDGWRRLSFWVVAKVELSEFSVRKVSKFVESNSIRMSCIVSLNKILLEFSKKKKKLGIWSPAWIGSGSTLGSTWSRIFVYFYSVLVEDFKSLWVFSGRIGFSLALEPRDKHIVFVTSNEGLSKSDGRQD